MKNTEACCCFSKHLIHIRCAKVWVVYIMYIICMYIMYIMYIKGSRNTDCACKAKPYLK